MNYVILDFEFNGVYSKKLNGYFNEIISIGAIKLDNNLNIIDEFSFLIKPVVSKSINKYVGKLTQLTMEELLSNGITFLEAIELFKVFLADATLVTWSISDIKVLSDNYKYFLNIESLDFIICFLDLQEYSEQAMNIKSDRRLGLFTALKLLNIEIDLKNVHNALYDSMLAYKCFYKLYNKKLIEANTVICSNLDLYKKVNFKNTITCDLTDLNIDISKIEFYCNNCGKEIQKTTDWEIKNKIFRAKFKCNGCKKEYMAKLKFVKTYDGIEIKKSQLLLDNKNGQ